MAQLTELSVLSLPGKRHSFSPKGDYFRIYRGQDGVIDYGNIVATMSLAAAQITISDQALPADTIWHYIRRLVRHCCGKESPDSPACIVRIDSNGDMIDLTPNTPQSLVIEPVAGAKLRLRWRYTPLAEEIMPTGFKVYIDSGSGFNFDSPADTVAYLRGGDGEFSWVSDALTNGQRYRFCVRSYTTGKGESQNTNYVAAIADSDGPAAITGLQSTWSEV